MIKIPYTETELLIAFIGISEEKLSEIIAKQIKQEMELILPKDKAEFNQKAAAHQGINIEVFMSSPNYKKFSEEYKEYLWTQYQKKLVERMDITEKQAWALIAVEFDFLKI